MPLIYTIFFYSIYTIYYYFLLNYYYYASRLSYVERGDIFFLLFNCSPRKREIFFLVAISVNKADFFKGLLWIIRLKIFGLPN